MTAEQTLSGLLAGITPPSAAAAQKAREHWNACAKPLGSLGLLEQAIEQIAGLTGSENVQLTPRRARSVTSRFVMSSPFNTICPAFGISMPAISRASVVLPLPLGPVMTTSLPSPTFRFTSLSTCFPSGAVQAM